MKAWEKNVRTVVPYVPGEQPNQIGMIKLNTNENPYPPAPGVQEAIKSLVNWLTFIIWIKIRFLSALDPMMCWPCVF